MCLVDLLPDRNGDLKRRPVATLGRFTALEVLISIPSVSGHTLPMADTASAYSSGLKTRLARRNHPLTSIFIFITGPAGGIDRIENPLGSPFAQRKVL
jgi:hypothetical protein